MVVYQENLINKNGYFECLIDGKCFKSFQALKEHVVKKLKYKTVYDYMIEYKIDDAKNYIRCEICGTHVINMRKHILAHKETNLIEYKEKYNLKYVLSDGLRKFYSKVKSGKNNTFHKEKSTYEKRANRSMYKMEHYKSKFPNLSEEEITKMIADKKKKCGDVLKKANTVQYWIDKGYDEQTANKMNTYKHCYGNIAKLCVVYDYDKAYDIANRFITNKYKKTISHYRISPYHEAITNWLNDKGIDYRDGYLEYIDGNTIFNHICIGNKYINFYKKKDIFNISFNYLGNTNKISINKCGIVDVLLKLEEFLYDKDSN